MVEVGGPRSLEICEVVHIVDAILAKAQLLKGGPGNLEPLKRDFPHSEPTFTTNFAVSTAQILRKNKEPNIIIYKISHYLII